LHGISSNELGRMDSNKCDRAGSVTFHVLNQRNPERTKTTPRVHEMHGKVRLGTCSDLGNLFKEAYLLGIPDL